MPDSFLRKQIGRIAFLLSCLLVAGLSGEAVLLMRAHPWSHRGLLLAQFSLVLLGVFWIRSLERRLADAALPRWCFWPYFLAVFAACFGAHALKFANGPETLALFLLLQLPALLLQSQPIAEASLKRAGWADLKRKTKPIAPLGAIKFAWFLFLFANLWEVLQLVHGDVGGFPHPTALKYAIGACSWLLLIPWFRSVRGRLKAFGRARWAIAFCAIVFVPSFALVFFRVVSFAWALVLFAVLQMPAIFLRQESISARLIPMDKDL